MPIITLAELGERIRKARKAAGLSQEEAAIQTGLLQPSISAIEAGKRAVDSFELARFAELYNRQVNYFLDSESINETQSFAPLFSSKNLLDSDRPIIDDFRIFCEDYAELERIVQGKPNIVRVFERLESPTTQQEALKQGIEYANELRKIFDLGIEPIYDIRLFLDAIGIKAIKRTLNNESLCGIYVFSQDFGHCVLVNRSGNRQLDRFSLTHCLCHVLLDWQKMKADKNYIMCNNWKNDSLIEFRANIFALNFLIPRDTLEKLWLQIRTQEKPGIFDIVTIARYFGVDYGATLHQLLHAGMLTEEERNTLEKYLITTDQKIDTVLGFRMSEVRFSGEELYPDRYIKLALEAYRLRRISVGRLAKFLARSIYETSELLRIMQVEFIDGIKADSDPSEKIIP